MYRIPSNAVKGLKDWQLFVLVKDDKLLAVFIDLYNNGSIETGRPFKTPIKAFLKALLLFNKDKRTLKARYGRFKQLQTISDK
jgi:hypothetical protein